MVNAMVERATNDKLIGPDWARNTEICDICNNDPTQAKDIVKGIKNRLRSRRPKVQLLALTLLEIIVKNCGDIIHMLVAERGLPREMVKIVKKKKKPDFHVKEKILILIYTWQDAFGGPRARYPQYFAAYQELLRLGAVFPRISETSGPVYTLSRPPPADSSVEPEFPTLSLTEIENARGIMDVLTEMLNAIGPENKEEVKQDLIIDLVGKCRAYKLRVVHLINSTTDESLLCEGLALNDDLQRILAKHEAISSGTIPIQSENKKPESAQPLVNIDAPLIDTGDKQSEKGSTSGTDFETQLLLTAPPATNGQLTTSEKVDLLSGDDLALVPVGEPQPTSPVASQQNNILALVDMFPQSNLQSSNSNSNSNSNGEQAFYSSSPQFQQQSNGQSPQPSLLPSGSASTLMVPQHEQLPPSQESTFAWNGQMNQHQLPDSPTYGSENSSALPPPPWEAQLDNSMSAISQPQGLQITQVDFQPSPGGPYVPAYHRPIQSGQVAYMHPQQMHGGQMAGYGYNYGYAPEPMQNSQYLGQDFSGLSLRDSSYPVSAPQYVPSGRPMKAEDKLFGDLVDISKFKPGRATAG